MISLRGMMTVAFLFAFDILYEEKRNQKHDFGLRTLPYLPAGLFALSFLLWHFLTKGWIGYFSGSTWAPAFERVNAFGLIKNLVILSWRLLDFGHLFIWAILLAYSSLSCVGGLYGRSFGMLKTKITTKPLLLGLVLSILMLTPTLLMYKGLLNHRYLLPIYLLLVFSAFQCVWQIQQTSRRNIGYVFLFLSLLTGNLWVYPQPIATGWDATLAHLPYYDLRNEMVTYIKAQNIPPQSVGTCFPNRRPFKYIDLLNTGEAAFADKDLNTNPYIFYSNVMNDFSGEELKELRSHWEAVKYLKSGQVEVILYKRR